LQSGGEGIRQFGVGPAAALVRTGGIAQCVHDLVTVRDRCCCFLNQLLGWSLSRIHEEIRRKLVAKRKPKFLDEILFQALVVAGSI